MAALAMRAGVLALSALAAACMTAPPQDAVAKFGTSLAAITATTSGAFRAAQNVETVENHAILAGKLTCRETGCDSIDTLMQPTSIITPALLETYNQVLGGIDAYAKVLASLTSPETAMLVSQSTARVGANLQTLSTRLSSATGNTGADPAAISAGAQAIGALGDFLVQEAVNKQLPEAIAQNHPAIVALAAYMDAVIGTPGSCSGTSKRTGLRGIVQTKICGVDTNLSEVVDRLRRDRTIGTIDLLTYGAKVYDDNVALAVQTDNALATVQAALKEMVAAHAALRAPEDPGTFEKIQSFAAFAARAEAAVQRAMDTAK